MEQLIESEADIMHHHVDNKMLYNVDFIVCLFSCFFHVNPSTHKSPVYLIPHPVAADGNKEVSAGVP